MKEEEIQAIAIQTALVVATVPVVKFLTPIQ